MARGLHNSVVSAVLLCKIHMLWLPVALLAPALAALGNYIDKHMLASYAKHGGIGAIVIFSSLFASVVIPVSLLFGQGVFAVTSFQGGVLIVNGCLTVIALLFYLYAIDTEDVLLSIPILQVVPVFAFVLGYLVLGETLSLRQLTGSLIVIAGTVIFSLEIQSWKNIRIKGRSLLLILGASLPLAVSGVVFKWAALDIGYWTTQFWEYIGIAIFGLLLFAAVPMYRNSFRSVFKSRFQTAHILSFILLAEVLMVASDLILNYAFLLAPVALVYVVNSFHPAFVFMYALIATLTAPHVVHGITWSAKHIAQRALTVAVMIAGVAMLYL